MGEECLNALRQARVAASGTAPGHLDSDTEMRGDEYKGSVRTHACPFLSLIHLQYVDSRRCWVEGWVSHMNCHVLFCSSRPSVALFYKWPVL